jgi:hypothetical protein
MFTEHALRVDVNVDTKEVAVILVRRVLAFSLK